VAETASGFRASLENMEQTEAHQQAGRRVLDLLRRKCLRVRVHVHGTFGTRAYLFERPTAVVGEQHVAVVGSGNVCLPEGFDPTQYHVELRERGAVEELIAWFDRLWE